MLDNLNQGNGNKQSLKLLGAYKSDQRKSSTRGPSTTDLAQNRRKKTLPIEIPEGFQSKPGKRDKSLSFGEKSSLNNLTANKIY